MKRIQKYVDHIEDELCGAKEYAEDSLYFKAKGDNTWASRYRDMANDELKHASYIHNLAVQEIELLKKTYTPPEEMLEAWEKSHTKYVEQEAWIKQMLAM